MSQEDFENYKIPLKQGENESNIKQIEIKSNIFGYITYDAFFSID